MKIPCAYAHATLPLLKLWMKYLYRLLHTVLSILLPLNSNMARLKDYDCIGFDLDHTFIQYRLDNLYPVSNYINSTICLHARKYRLNVFIGSINKLKLTFTSGFFGCCS